MTTLLPDIADRVEQVRAALAGALRSRVIGPDADDKQARVMLAPGERWFPDNSPVRTVHSDASMFIGGMRALLLQSLHPLAMAGVAEHSDYRNDPWGRLQRTAEFLAATTFGPAELAQHAVDAVRAVHSRVHGVTADGTPYSADDPHLLRWVHVAEIDSFLVAYQAYGAGRLAPHEADGYVAGMARIAHKLGVPAPPLSVRGLHDQLTMFRPELRSSPQSRDAARYLLLEPPLDAAARVPYMLIASAAIATLPAWARAELRLPWLPLADRLVARPVGVLVARAIRWASAVNEPQQPAS
ncbi:MAG: oxygenase MpaB family protein [Ilumatobacteraceae bacterium]